MKKRDKPFRLSKKILECLAVILLFGMTTFAASGGMPGTTTTYSTEGSTSAEDATYSTTGGAWVQVDENTWTMDKDHDGKTDVTLVKKGISGNICSRQKIRMLSIMDGRRAFQMDTKLLEKENEKILQLIKM